MDEHRQPRHARHLYSDVIPGYNANQIYYYRVRNTIGSHYSALAAWNTGLAAPTNFAVAGVTTSSVTLTWTSPLGASGAWIQQYNSSNGSWSTVSPSSLQASVGTYTVTGLSGGTTYTFRMRASSDADSVYSSYTSSLNADHRHAVRQSGGLVQGRREFRQHAGRFQRQRKDCGTYRLL